VPENAGNYEAVMQRIQNNPDAMAALRSCLDSVWTEYQMQGCILLYPWHDKLRESLAGSFKLTPGKPIVLRAFDPLLVLNVLARTREGLLQADAALNIDPHALDQSLISDDPRLVKLVQSSAYFEEPIQSMAADFPAQESSEV
jgi:hypothetical protein